MSRLQQPVIARTGVKQFDNAGAAFFTIAAVTDDVRKVGAPAPEMVIDIDRRYPSVPCALFQLCNTLGDGPGSSGHYRAILETEVGNHVQNEQSCRTRI